MLIKNSLRQLFRRRKQTLLFVVLLILASGLCALGQGYLTSNQKKMEKYESSFHTIGTVEQKADFTRESQNWDAEDKSWHTYWQPAYESILPLEILDFPDARYLSEPEKRVCYGAYSPEYEMYDNGLTMAVMIEASPVEDAVPDHPIEMVVKKALYGTYMHEGVKIRFCDHYNPEPKMLYKDKTYIMCVCDDLGHDSEKEFPEDMVREYRPAYNMESTQCDVNGIPMESVLPEDYYYEEITEGFYETEKGKYWLNCLDAWEYVKHVFPVTGTNNIQLMMAFYRGDVAVSEGREFTREEYEKGRKVCLVSDQFAAKNNLTVGDCLRLPLLFADYKRSAGWRYSSYGVRSTSMLNAQGEVYPVFEDSEYEIVGTYSGLGGVLDEYGLGYQEIVIPAKSVKNSDADNIIASGPMLGSTTSFEIANGTIEEFMEKWSQVKESGKVEINFYDHGYSRLASHIKNMRWLAVLILTFGVVMILATLSYFCWLFVVKEKERVAVERAIGFHLRQSFLSLFSGIFLILLVGTAAGCVCGTFLSGELMERSGNTSYYDTAFSRNVAVEMEDIPMEEVSLGELACSSAATGGVIVLVGALLAGVVVYHTVKKEPLEMFGKEE